MHPLDGPRLKVRRAKSEIECLSRFERAFQKDAKYQIVRAELNPKNGYHAYRIRGEVSIDPIYGVWLREIIHNLRSALDNLVYQLVILNGQTPTGRAQFPIFTVGRTTRRRYRAPGKGQTSLIPHFEVDGRAMLHGVKPEHQAVIKGLQPYKTSARPKLAFLYLLSEINNADKHRVLQVAGAKIGSYAYNLGNQKLAMPFMPSTASSYRSVVFLKDGAKVFWAAPGVQVAPQLIPQIAFWKGCEAVRGRAVEPNLRAMQGLVSKIIEGFSPEFG